MPTKKMISVKECEKFAKINAQNAVNSYKQSKKGLPEQLQNTINSLSR